MLKINYTKLNTSIKICWLLLFAIYIFCIITGQRLSVTIENEFLIKIDTFITSQPVIFSILNLITYYFNMIIIFYAILKKKMFSYKPITLSSIILISWSLKTIFIQFPIVNYLDFVTFGILVAFIPKKWYRIILGTVFTFLITILTTFVKNYFIVDYDLILGTSFVTGLFLMIDVYIIEILYYLYSRKGGDIYEPFRIFWKTQMDKIKNCWVYCVSVVSSCKRRNRNHTYDLTELYCNVIFDIITYSTLIIIGIVYNRCLEVLISSVVFHILRDTDTKTFHASTSLKCFFTSILSFFIITKLSLPLSTSIFMAIMLAYWLSTVMYYIQDWYDMTVKFKRTLQSLTLEEMKELFPKRCDYDIKCVYAYLNRGTALGESIALKYHYSVRQIQRIIKDMKKDLNEGED